MDVGTQWRIYGVSGFLGRDELMMTVNKKEVVSLRKTKCLSLVLVVCTFSALMAPMKVKGQEVGSGETTIHIRVPDTHSIKMDIGDHGSLRINGTTYKGIREIDVERLSYPRFEIIADKGYEINTVYYQGKNVTGEVKNNLYTAPLLYEEGITFKVDFKKGSANSEEGNIPDDGSSNDSDPSKENNTPSGDIIDGNHESNNGGVPGNSDLSDKKETGGSSGSDSLNGAEHEAGNSAEDKKNEILNELEKIDNLLKNEPLSAEEKAELLERKQELLQNMTLLIYDESLKSKSDIEKTLVNIETLLARQDLTNEQRQKLQEKKEELTKQLEEIETIEKQHDLFKFSIIVLIMVSGGIYIFYRKKKKNISSS